MMGYGIADAFGSSLSGFIYPFFAPRSLLVFFCLVRSSSQFFVAFLYWRLPELWWLILLLYVVDSFAVGCLDTTRTSFPRSLVGKDAHALDRMNADFQLFFDLGTMIGPLITGLVMLNTLDLYIALYLSPCGFVVAALLFLLSHFLHTSH